VQRGAAGLGARHAPHVHHAAAATVNGPALVATAVHTAGYLLVTALLALVVHRHASAGAGLGVRRSAWVNVDLVWATALVLTAVAVTFS
jgi:hypothetical protein